jgi:uncharacterized membrane protein YdbT with pleckstrin-like domain
MGGDRSAAAKRARAGRLDVAYVDKVLEDGEHVSYRGRLSPISFLLGATILIVGVLIMVAGAGVTALWYFGVAVAVIGALEIGRTWIRRVTTEIAVTDRRVILKRGLISRRTLEMNLTRIESVDVRQGIAGRILNFGDVVIRGTGSGMEPIRGIDSPIEFRRRVLS